ncbi:MAG: sulfatase, partial [Candidatus Eisenbacteria bacterium]|nr:sulfatase [Candidatus Eisenbacteria bacterium]
MRSRCAAAMGGVYAGALLGALAGAVEALLFLEGPNFSTTPGSSIVFFLLSMSLYALAMAAAGAVIGLAASVLPRRGKAAGSRFGHPFSVAFGAIGGIFAFVLGTWGARMAPPDLSIFRLYFLPKTLLILLACVIGGGVLFQLAWWIARIDRVERYFASRWARAWTLAKLALALLFLTLVLALEPGGRPAGTSEHAAFDGTGVNVVLITIDTLRADHLEFLGYPLPTSPVTKEMSGGAVVFSECVAQYPLTTPSHASILTARYVQSHGATGNAVPLGDSAVLLSEVLKRHGYSTAAFITSPIIGQSYGFSRGYDCFVERNRGDFRLSSFSDWIGQLRISRMYWCLNKTERTTAATRRWLENSPETPFFLWLHYITPHSPYAPTFPYERAWDVYASSIIPSIRGLQQVNDRDETLAPADLNHIVALYDAEIAFTEDLLGSVFETLKSRGLLRNTLIVFTADHGESLYDRGRYFGHGRQLYDEEILVPLFFYCPERLPGGRTIDVPVETIHIAPTILDFLELPPEPSFQGISLMSFVCPGWPDPGVANPRHAPEEMPAFSIRNKGRAVRFNGWKYIEVDDEHGTEMLFDLESDPGEVRNVVIDEP